MTQDDTFHARFDMGLTGSEIYALLAGDTDNLEQLLARPDHERALEELVTECKEKRAES